MRAESKKSIEILQNVNTENLERGVKVLREYLKADPQEPVVGNSPIPGLCYLLYKVSVLYVVSRYTFEGMIERAPGFGVYYLGKPHTHTPHRVAAAKKLIRYFRNEIRRRRDAAKPKPIVVKEALTPQLGAASIEWVKMAIERLENLTPKNLGQFGLCFYLAPANYFADSNFTSYKTVGSLQRSGEISYDLGRDGVLTAKRKEAAQILKDILKAELVRRSNL